VRESVAHITDSAAEAALVAERAVVEALGGGCQMPLGALATVEGETMLDLVASVIALDGSRVVRSHARAALADAAALGTRVGARLLDEGAAEILDQVRKQSS
jgi:hydroxymethylbilane synthase